MAQREESATSADDWRLEAELDAGQGAGAAGTLMERLRGHGSSGGAPAGGAREGVPEGVVVTHDGRRLFAYAADEQALMAARRAIERVLHEESVGATVRVSRWTEELDRWHQVDPPLEGGEALAQQRAEQQAGAPETRTLVAHVGKLARRDFEQTMLGGARSLGLECEVVEHPHLLTTQVAFTVTGPRHKVEEFAATLRAEGWAAVRADTQVILSPL